MVFGSPDDEAVFSHLPALTLFLCWPKSDIELLALLACCGHFSHRVLGTFCWAVPRSLKPPEGLPHFGKTFSIRGGVFLSG